VKMYCATYDPSSSSPTQISSEPCVSNAAGSDGNTTSPHTAQLFSWNSSSGEVTPLWHKDAGQPPVDTTSEPGGAPDPASQSDGFVVGQSLTAPGTDQEPTGKLAMVFRAVSSVTSPSSNSTSTESNAVPDSTDSGTSTEAQSLDGDPSDSNETPEPLNQEGVLPSTTSTQQAAPGSTVAALGVTTTQSATAAAASSSDASSNIP
jgi:hypothetical protein